MQAREISHCQGILSFEYSKEKNFLAIEFIAIKRFQCDACFLFPAINCDCSALMGIWHDCQSVTEGRSRMSLDFLLDTTMGCLRVQPLKASTLTQNSGVIIFQNNKILLSVHAISMKSFSSFPEHFSIFLATIEDYSN